MSRALFIGRSVMDVTALVEDFPGPDGKTKALSNDVIPGGSALNAAVTFAHLGGTAALATSLGAPGPMKTMLTSDLKDRNVTVHDISNDPDYRIPLSTVVSTRSLGARMIVNGAGDECEKVRSQEGLILTEGYGLIQIDQYERHFVAAHADALRAFEGPIILDGGGWKDWSPDFLKLADIPIVSDVFCPEGLRAFANMCEELDIQRWAMTRGHAGVVWHDQGRRGEIPALEVDVVDSLGAGDIYHGAFCHAYLETGSFVDALNIANQIAGKSCTHAGTRSWMDA
ncbi:PfkB family carbohydrate kinase [uncultured Ruegeria sp.]|uniref:PfkB family carbohydrate kinase n=1 Tax=uncultured Ruegeria sp. TaxID=259304 RepID=UPI002625BE9A|nr:PfkB family carbohydrate kinase [uncultured Ruegeria sp.]